MQHANESAATELEHSSTAASVFAALADHSAAVAAHGRLGATLGEACTLWRPLDKPRIGKAQEVDGKDGSDFDGANELDEACASEAAGREPFIVAGYMDISDIVSELPSSLMRPLHRGYP